MIREQQREITCGLCNMTGHTHFDCRERICREWKIQKALRNSMKKILLVQDEMERNRQIENRIYSNRSSNNVMHIQLLINYYNNTRPSETSMSVLVPLLCELVTQYIATISSDQYIQRQQMSLISNISPLGQSIMFQTRPNLSMQYHQYQSMMHNYVSYSHHNIDIVQPTMVSKRVRILHTPERKTSVDTCSICLSDNKELFMHLGCGHSFCSCIVRHVNKSKSRTSICCPNCRQTIENIGVSKRDQMEIVCSCLEQNPLFEIVSLD